MQSDSPMPPVCEPETIELKGTTNQDDLPSSRGEWSGFFPSIKQRRASFGADNPPILMGRQPSEEEECNNNSTKSETSNTKPKSPKKGPAPAPPAAHQTNGQSAETQAEINGGLSIAAGLPVAGDSPATGEETGKKKSVKKVVKRTVSVKRSSIPAASFGDGPPDDGSDYIKICGKWVKMKAKSAQANKARAENSTTPGVVPSQPQQGKTRGDSLSSQTEEESIPASRAEWGDNVNIGWYKKIIIPLR